MKSLKYCFGLLILVCVSWATFASAQIEIPNVYVDKLVIENTNLKPGDPLKGSFDLFNFNDSSQSNFEYIVYLKNDKSQGNFFLQNREGITLNSKERKAEEFVTTVPNISGDFTLFVDVVSPSGIVTGQAFKEIHIQGPYTPVLISSTKIFVDGESFEAGSGPTVSKDTIDYAELVLVNSSDKTILLTPHVDVYKKSAHKDGVISAKDFPQVTILAKGNQTVKIALPKNMDPEVHVGVVSFVGDSVPEMSFRYIVGGQIATIQSVTSASSTVKRGDIVSVNVSYTGTPDNITTASSSIIGGSGSIEVELLDSNNKSLGSAKNNIEFVDEASEPIDIKLNTTTSGAVFANVKILGSSGTILSEGKYSLDVIQSKNNFIVDILNNISWQVASFIALIIVLIAILAAIWLHRKNSVVSTIASVFVSLGIIGASYLGGHIINAESGADKISVDPVYYTNSESCTYDTFVLSSDKKSYQKNNVTDYKCSFLTLGNYNICQYVTSSVDKKGVKTYKVTNTGATCDSIVQSGDTCTYTANKVSKTIKSCVEGIKRKDSLSLDTNSSCDVVTKDSKGNELPIKTISKCIPVGSEGGVCTYYVNNKLTTLKSCVSVAESSLKETVVAESCSIKYTLNGKIKTASFPCLNLSIVDNVCTFKKQNSRTKEWENQTINDCASAKNTLAHPSLRFTNIIPDSTGRYVFKADTTQELSGNIAYNKCYNSPSDGAIEMRILDSSENFIGSVDDKFHKGKEDGNKHEVHLISQVFGPASFEVPSEEGQYWIDFSVSYIGRGAGGVGSFKGRIPFYVDKKAVTDCLPGDTSCVEPPIACGEGDINCPPVANECPLGFEMCTDGECRADCAQSLPADSGVNTSGASVDSGLPSVSAGDMSLLIGKSNKGPWSVGVDVSSGTPVYLGWNTVDQNCTAKAIGDTSAVDAWKGSKVSSANIITEFVNGLQNTTSFSLTCGSTTKTVKAVIRAVSEF